MATEETFGPVAGLFRFSSEEEVVVSPALPPYSLRFRCKRERSTLKLNP